MRILFFLFLPCAALADTPLSGAEFDAFVSGRTLTYSANGIPYGVEYYAPSQRVIWSVLDGTCEYGKWYEASSPTGPQICFVYEDDPEPNCWQIFMEGNRMRADFMNQPDSTVLYMLDETEPLICDGAGV